LPKKFILNNSQRDIGDPIIGTAGYIKRKGYVTVSGPLQRDIIVLNPAGRAELDSSNLRFANPPGAEQDYDIAEK